MGLVGPLKVGLNAEMKCFLFICLGRCETNSPFKMLCFVSVFHGKYPFNFTAVKANEFKFILGDKNIVEMEMRAKKVTAWWAFSCCFDPVCRYCFCNVNLILILA